MTFGESHGRAVGVVIDGVRPGIPLNEEDLQRELDRRRPGQSRVTSPRRERDRAEILSGVFEGRTTGAPVCIVVWNEGARPQDYEPIKDVFRPGHGDFSWLKKYGIRDYRGGGRLSGRETIGRVAAGALAKKLLEQEGIEVVGATVEVLGVEAERFDEQEIENNPMRCPDPVAAKEMENVVLEAAREGDSVGGIVEVVARGVPPGLGDPVFWKLDALLAQALVSIGGVKGVEIGAGFAAARMKGSEHNDQMDEEGFLSNNAGGILGGISTGQPIVLRIAVKPPSSIRKQQKTIDTTGRPRTITVEGRHDPCICPRVVPVAEAMVRLVLADALLRQKAIEGAPSNEVEAELALALTDADIVTLLARRKEIVSRLGADAKKREMARLRQVFGALGIGEALGATDGPSLEPDN